MPKDTLLTFEMAVKADTEEAELDFCKTLEKYAERKAKQMGVKIIAGPNNERQTDTEYKAEG